MSEKCSDIVLLPRDAYMHSADYAMARCLSVYRTSEAVSVRPSVTRRYFVETAKHIIEVFPPSDSHTILVFCTKLRRGPERRIPWVMKNHHFRPISQFISEMMRDKAIVTMEGQ